MAGFLETAVEIAREAGALLLQMAERRPPAESKGEFDLVTAADRASEQLIVERLRSHFPTHGILAEEGSEQASTSGYRWYVDPLDGTTNYAHGYPMFAATLGLEKDGRMIAAATFDPSRNEMFAAERGAGAYLNGKKIHVSKAARVAESLCSTGFPSRKRHHNINVHFFYQLAMVSHGVRRGGSAAIDLAYVACGRLDGFWEFGLKPWDMAAGVLLVEEAGGQVTDMRGGPLALTGDHLLATNGALHAETVRVFAEVFAGEFRTPMPKLP